MLKKRRGWGWCVDCCRRTSGLSPNILRSLPISCAHGDHYSANELDLGSILKTIMCHVVLCQCHFCAFYFRQLFTFHRGQVLRRTSGLSPKKYPALVGIIIFFTFKKKEGGVDCCRRTSDLSHHDHAQLPTSVGMVTLNCRNGDTKMSE